MEGGFAAPPSYSRRPPHHPTTESDAHYKSGGVFTHLRVPRRKGAELGSEDGVCLCVVSQEDPAPVARKVMFIAKLRAAKT